MSVFYHSAFHSEDVVSAVVSDVDSGVVSGVDSGAVSAVFSAVFSGPFPTQPASIPVKSAAARIIAKARVIKDFILVFMVSSFLIIGLRYYSTKI